MTAIRNTGNRAAESNVNKEESAFDAAFCGVHYITKKCIFSKLNKFKHYNY